VPRDWKIQFEISEGLQCQSEYKFRRPGDPRICYGGPQPQGLRPQSGGYSFYSSKRHAKALDGGATPKECQKVDTFKHENGQQYNITGMSDNQVEELLALAQNGTATADFPRGLQGAGEERVEGSRG
jgi:hypothetical protein